MNDKLLEVKDLKKYFGDSKKRLHAVDGLTFSIDKGKKLGVVGESGCGKSTMGRAVLRLHEPTAGSVIFGGEDIVAYSKARLRKFRARAQIIFQDPYASLNPRKTVSEIIGEPLRLHKTFKTKGERYERVLDLMELVGLAERLINTYPHELDGGRRQRIGIARALALNPEFIVCDEPVSALDVSIQAQILNLLDDLQGRLNLTYMFITHDLSVVNYFSDDILVMYLGKMVEMASSAELFANPLHPYTKALLSAIPVPDLHAKKERVLLRGEVASPINPPPVCRFLPRCDYAEPVCAEEEPPLKEISGGHMVACHLY
ncbi:MAG: ATP-binding cassette domain-containing protein [Clostridiales Family XIII bacterium]|jgi:peptide/nickel transport system ATP-binding protein|nr:ATP-binding cassette domain-containing protein [Clostridiales Family XIII bacterium]